jgi:hypothetical protein
MTVFYVKPERVEELRNQIVKRHNAWYEQNKVKRILRELFGARPLIDFVSRPVTKDEVGLETVASVLEFTVADTSYWIVTDRQGNRVIQGQYNSKKNA